METKKRLVSDAPDENVHRLVVFTYGLTLRVECLEAREAVHRDLCVVGGIYHLHSVYNCTLHLIMLPLEHLPLDYDGTSC